MAILKETALIYCEDQFGLADGKTATGLVRHSDRYTIVGIIDSSLAGKDAGEVLGDKKNNIPIFAHLDDALHNLSSIPHCYIYGKAPLETSLSGEERVLILDAMSKGMNIINGLHQFFSEDPEFVEKASQCKIEIQDIRKPPSVKNLHVFTGRISEVTIPVIAVLGTDCACGKMTTAIELNKALNNQGVKSVMVATGQTSLIQGAKYGISVDALVSQFVIGEIEHAVLQAFYQECPDVILVEGQSSLSHPAFMSSLGILKGSLPDGIILQHPPARRNRCDFPHLAMPNLEQEIKLVETVAQSPVIAIALSHENLAIEDLPSIIRSYEHTHRLPTTDVLTDGCQKLICMLIDRFPTLHQQIQPKSLDTTPVLAMR